MLEEMVQVETALRIREALRTVIQTGETVTSDLGGTAGTTEFANAIIDEIQA
jgi:isocitrate dehydrogenase (NAD+)